MNTIVTARLRALAEAAEPGMWPTGREWEGQGVKVDARDAAYIAAADPRTILALLDEIERLRQWKAEAMQVHAEWEKTWIAAGRPGRLGTSNAAGVRDEIERLNAADQRAAELAAVIEQTEDFVTRHYLDTEMGRRLIEVLAIEPGDALREHDEALIEGLADQIRHKQHAESIRQMLREKARQRRGHACAEDDGQGEYCKACGIEREAGLK